MKTVWKFDVPVDDRVHELHIPGPMKICHVACQNNPDSVQLWVEVNPDAEAVRRRFIVHGTGHEVHSESVHVGTALVPGLPLVWHLYEV